MGDQWPVILAWLIGCSQGLIIGYILWALDSAFKRGFVDGLTLRFLWQPRNKVDKP